VLLPTVSPHFHSIKLKQLIFLNVNLEVLAHFKEITEEHLLTLLAHSLEGHFLNTHQMLFAVKVIDLCHALLLQFCYIHYFWLSYSWRGWFLLILVRRVILIIIRLLKTLIVVIFIKLLLLIIFFFIRVDLRMSSRRMLLVHHSQLSFEVI